MPLPAYKTPFDQIAVGPDIEPGTPQFPLEGLGETWTFPFDFMSDGSQIVEDLIDLPADDTYIPFTLAPIPESPPPSTPTPITERERELLGEALVEAIEACRAKVPCESPEVESAVENLVAATRERVARLSLEIPEPRPQPAPERYPVRQGVDPLEFLKKHYGQFLAYFSAPYNSLCQRDLEKWDLSLLEAVRNRVKTLRRESGSRLRVQDVVPRSSDLFTEQLGAVPDSTVAVWKNATHALARRRERTKA